MAQSFTLDSRVDLPSGEKIPRLGYGLWQTPADKAKEVVTFALQHGYRHIDSAAVYKNEEGCGAAIRDIASTIPRSDIFFTSKIPPRNISYETAVEQIDLTLRTTGLDYIDLMLIHAPYGGPAKRKGAWKAMVEAVEAGKIRSIGVSNYGVHHLDELERHIRELEEERGGKGKGGVLSVGQWEIHPWLPRADITEWCARRGVAVEAYSPIVRGERWGEKPLVALAEKHGKSEAQVLLRWSLQKGFIPLPKSVTESRIIQNKELYDFELTAEDMKSLETGEYAPVCWDPTVTKLEE